MKQLYLVLNHFYFAYTANEHTILGNWNQSIHHNNGRKEKEEVEERVNVFTIGKSKQNGQVNGILAFDKLWKMS